MKKKITKTVTETEVTCDHCGRLTGFYPDACIVCGKHACGDCLWKSVLGLDMDEWPRFYAQNCSMPTFHAVVCVGCENALTKRFANLKQMRDAANAKCKEWHSHYLAEVKWLAAEQRKIEEARG